MYFDNQILLCFYMTKLAGLCVLNVSGEKGNKNATLKHKIIPRHSTT